MTYKGYNATIVKNGLVINSSYFDQDLNNFVFTVPADVNSTRFWAYMKT